MKRIYFFIIAMTLGVTVGSPAEEISREVLIDAYISYHEKAAGIAYDEAQKEELRTELMKAPNHPIISAYSFPSDTFEREPIEEKLIKYAVEKELIGGETSKFKSIDEFKAFLSTLIEAELVIALRMTNKIDDQLNEAKEAEQE